MFWNKKNEKETKGESQNKQDVREFWEEKYGINGTTDPEVTMQYLINCSLHGMMMVEDEVRGNGIYIPKWDMMVIPEISQLVEQGIVLNFYIIAPKWGKQLFECCVGAGSDPRTNLGMATASFIFAFMQTMGRMEENENPRKFKTVFGGKTHSWEMFAGDIVGMGKSSGAVDTNIYWDALGEDIKKRLGNQKLCYVKIYGSKMGDDIVGECRIDDVESPELSKKVAEMVSKWDAEGFCSQKQFFFIRQDEETLLPDIYSGEEGKKLFKSRVIEAVNLMHECTNEEFENIDNILASKLGDTTLAAECRLFLPEMCTQNAFSDASYSENMSFFWPDNRKENVYKNQLADYYPIWDALFSAFSEGVFGEETDVIYRELIGMSASYNSISQMLEKNKDLKGACLTAIGFCVNDEFELR